MAAAIVGCSRLTFDSQYISEVDMTAAKHIIRLQVYLAWVDAWVSSSEQRDAIDAIEIDEYGAEESGFDRMDIPSMSSNEMADLFQDEYLPYLLKPDILAEVVHAFRQHLVHRRIKVGGSLAPSSPETNVFSERYDPRVECNCAGDTRDDKTTLTDLSLWQDSECQSIRRTVAAAQRVINNQHDWKQEIFTTQGLTDAIIELFLSNSDPQPIPDTCHGSGLTNPIPEIRAPDRRPNPECDSDPNVHDSLFPTTEKIKLCADAKYFFAMACGGSLCDEGLLRAIADAGNDVLIGDYGDAMDEKTLTTLRRDGAAAVAFLKLCKLADVVTAIQFDNLVASLIQFRVLGYYRDHGRASLAGGLYGSHTTGLVVHRYIDSAIWVGVMSASLATGEEITETKYFRLVTVCSLFNDLVDLRGDAMRKQRENPILRGVRGRLCGYLDSCISQCLTLACETLGSDRLSGMVVLGFCNWVVMASHHKVYELVNGVREVDHYSTCKYDSTEDETKYNNLLRVLEHYGTLGKDGPHVLMGRATMDKLYSINRDKSETHLAWMADITRSLLKPEILRKIVDVVHFEWKGDIGDGEYCP
ncbi:conserved hypothetical protein [Talaromyces stipitatus ATCC 10500]|uniref:Uncharacterized protein n=1 Tax=Talaromyces stipitatus (strain ATCC 10500 / CBS 375.48 / QM 6759 / NRRL 1006) TaxID=441959 RepID=B8MD00_TALSN|nr:uncharacterized protein TSTA_113520 [Talaromyces stipitatus ATCC 10500]XP_002481519.1 uncharacterized protein TSTA_113520 [Talaromyces stipitatus ATCC 10500]XP_002481520.1 uncharacterized protein TSTA_113520 [Talaromyces stipitatus ATCC 10500]EED17526.1 conserved hypothetical protein [Talaromyces stipitatus ATCC 10500]EED17527.1 conserved hypothetical protein [Talaromyces stipitatus ATCC 10500]EED17528.1 conserved hypothetical protein [Talaromyces stipitatus ATCC 10500]